MKKLLKILTEKPTVHPVASYPVKIIRDGIETIKYKRSHRQ